MKFLMKIQFTTILLYSTWWLVASSPLLVVEENHTSSEDDLSNLRSRQRTKTTSRLTTDDESKIDYNPLSSDRQLQTSITITGISVRNVNTGKEIIPDLKEGQIIELNRYGLTKPSEINFQVYHKGNPTKVGSMRFGYDRNNNFSTDNNEPFALCGNLDRNLFSSCTELTLGTHTVRITPYAGDDGTGGIVGSAFTRKFTIAFQEACPKPTFTGEWENIKAYPLNVAESIGGTMTNIDGSEDIVVFSGFANQWTATTRAVYAYNTWNDRSATWRRMDDIPHPIGLTHSGFVIMKGGKIMYMCGGYAGGTPGDETPLCYKYEHRKPPSKQWSALPSLPRGRSGGALLYLVRNNSLLYATGATRDNPLDPLDTTDFNTVWELSLNGDVGLNKWEQRAFTPYKGNHVSYASVENRTFIFGGQTNDDEYDGNLADAAEYNVPTGKWSRRKSMNFPRGHSSSSSRSTPNGCGIITAGGTMNNRKTTSDISFHSVADDTWTTIGDLPQKVNTPVCDLVNIKDGNQFFYCVTGFVNAPFAYRRRIANV